MLEPMLADEIIRGFEDSDALLARLRSQERPSQPHIVKQLWLMFEIKQVQVVEAILQILKQNIPAREQISRTYLSKFPEEALENHFVASMLLVAQRLLTFDADLLFSTDISPLASCVLVYLVDIKLILQQQRHNLAGPVALELFLSMHLFQEVLYKLEYKVLSILYDEKDEVQLEEQQIVAVLFCEAVTRALRNGYLTQEMLDSYEPSLMLSIPCLDIVCGILFYPGSPLNLSFPSALPSIFMPYEVSLHQIQYLLNVLTSEELVMLERLLVMTDCEDLYLPTARTTARQRTLPLYPSGQQSSSYGEPRIPAMLSAYSSSCRNLLHKLFLSISEVVAKIQSDSATEFSEILKMVFQMMVPMAEAEPPSFGQDRPASTCQGCRALFLLFRLKKYCQICSKAFCRECVSYRIPCGQNERQLKVCHFCYFSYLYSVGLYIPLGVLGPHG